MIWKLSPRSASSWTLPLLTELQNEDGGMRDAISDAAEYYWQHQDAYLRLQVVSITASVLYEKNDQKDV